MGKVLCCGKQDHSLSQCRHAWTVGALIYQVIEDMEFSYGEKDAYRVIWRDLRQMHVKYICGKGKLPALFLSAVPSKHTQTSSSLAGLQNYSYTLGLSAVEI